MRISVKEAKWLRETIADILEDNVHHNICNLWYGDDEDSLDGKYEEVERKEALLRKAAETIRRTGKLP